MNSEIEEELREIEIRTGLHRMGPWFFISPIQPVLIATVITVMTTITGCLAWAAYRLLGAEPHIVGLDPVGTVPLWAVGASFVAGLAIATTWLASTFRTGGKPAR